MKNLTEPPPGRKRSSAIGWGALVIAVFAGVIGRDLAGSGQRNPPANSHLSQIAETQAKRDVVLKAMKRELNKDLPKFVDAGTRLDAFSVDDLFYGLDEPSKKSVTYHYTMVGTLREEIDIPTYEADMRQKLEKSYRELDSLRFFRENQLTVRYEYKDRDGELVMIIVLHP